MGEKKENEKENTMKAAYLVNGHKGSLSFPVKIYADNLEGAKKEFDFRYGNLGFSPAPVKRRVRRRLRL